MECHKGFDHKPDESKAMFFFKWELDIVVTHHW